MNFQDTVQLFLPGKLTNDEIFTIAKIINSKMNEITNSENSYRRVDQLLMSASELIDAMILFLDKK